MSHTLWAALATTCPATQSDSSLGKTYQHIQGWAHLKLPFMTTPNDVIFSFLLGSYASCRAGELKPTPAA